MKILVLGAGATGGYFGGRLAATGADVTFLVRPARAERLRRDGLIIKSPFGDVATPVNVVTTDQITAPFDVVMLSCKAYDLSSAITAITPACGPDTLILPLLNGMRHLNDLDQAFGPARVLGGTCHLSVTLDEAGVVHHLNQLHLLTYGPRSATQQARCDALLAIFTRAGFDARLSPNIVASMWEKWVLLASLAGMTTLMQSSVGAIATARGGRDTMLRMIGECQAIATAEGFAPSDAHMAMIRNLLTDETSAVVASMLRDMQRGAPVEAEHIIGDLSDRGRAAGLTSVLLDAALTNLGCYAARRTA
ncbi:MAG: 2-dehydropantoate 2-reductase [Hyphomicrobium sp.]